MAAISINVLRMSSPVGRRCEAARHTPTHHGEFALGAGVAHHRCGVIGENAGHRRQVADVAVDDAEQGGDCGPVGRDRIEITH